jgi:hypothetical protein
MKNSIFSTLFLLCLFAASPLRANPKPILPSEAPTPVYAPPIKDLKAPDGKVVPDNGRVTVKLINKTKTKIAFTFLGFTRQKILDGKANFQLNKLPLPLSVSFSRVDRGFLKVSFKSISKGVLEVILEETTDFDVDTISLWIRPNGEAYLD